MTTIQRDCPNCPDPCKERHQTIFDLLFREKDETGGTKGLVHRFAEQIAKGAQGPGTKSWIGHETAIVEQQARLKKQIRGYKGHWVDHEDGSRGPCPDTPLTVEAEKWADKPVPTAAEWSQNNPTNANGSSRMALGIGAGVLTIGAIGALLFPFDGPVGETVLGTAALGAWQQALSN
jgi:hypothetical protein